jgi:hypothetical protein
VIYTATIVIDTILHQLQLVLHKSQLIIVAIDDIASTTSGNGYDYYKNSITVNLTMTSAE